MTIFCLDFDESYFRYFSLFRFSSVLPFLLYNLGCLSFLFFLFVFTTLLFYPRWRVTDIYTFNLLFSPRLCLSFLLSVFSLLSLLFLCVLFISWVFCLLCELEYTLCSWLSCFFRLFVLLFSSILSLLSFICMIFWLIFHFFRYSIFVMVCFFRFYVSLFLVVACSFFSLPSGIALCCSTLACIPSYLTSLVANFIIHADVRSQPAYPDLYEPWSG